MTSECTIEHPGGRIRPAGRGNLLATALVRAVALLLARLNSLLESGKTQYTAEEIRRPRRQATG